ncbi:cdc42 effector protein 2-like [Salvelinus sp. IW2-2015]|uniref:cdc42 effector protein 2-like n=1 Tax=Salvelinus sp. IW2-2015 TaxID=2691554 RepID=UPI000CDF9E8F|nr:cdc42 effector protein 2-like [Salvelinus alpinus]XP_023843775.1 cdc42 effector protein 2-like [Salvelinus alpinus]
MSTKAPIYLKRRSRKGKKEKLRDILSSDMISPPLGDFRHTIHIGSGGGEDDLFGDLSFLEGKFHLLPGQQGDSISQRSSMYAEPFQFSRTASISGHTASSESSPLLKNALSLPVIGGLQAITLPVTSAPPTVPHPPQNAAPPPKPPRLHLDDKILMSHHPGLDSPLAQTPSRTSQFCPPSPRFPSDDDVCIQDPYLDDRVQERPYLSNAGSLLSLHLDLGPSILDDVLQIMDRQRLNGLNGTCLQGGRQELYT